MYFLLLFLAMFCQNPNHNHSHSTNTPNGQVTTLDDDPGDTGHIPPKPPTPPGGGG